MKKLILLSALLIFAFSCDDDSQDNPIPAYTMEGKWIWDPLTINDGIFIYEDGIRYTYYWDGVTPVEQLQELFNSFEAGDGNHIPGTNNYTFENDILTVDLNFGNELVTPITFDCDGGIATFITPEYSLYKLNSDCD
jgi:hypothetical protein|tara:strand:+ start:51 stop:461 length:411 start_codon:yes stop_codon:yes gene_type:complete